ncbi:multidrug resistance-associated protein 5 [Tanacetum coccineum]
MIPGTDLYCFDVHNDEKSSNYYQGLYYQVPNQDLERGLVRVSDNRSLSYMFDVEEIFGRLNLYLDHLDMDLSEYLSQAITYDMDAYSNPGSTVKLGVTVNPDDKTYFDRFYVCFARLADGWKAWCRKIIALDGCFLKSPNQEDLGSNRENGLTMMSDQHTGLMEAVKDVLPNAENRQCARHIYENFRKQYIGLEFRGCEAIENGFSECFNSMIVSVRHKPLLTMLEAIRVIVLERMNTMREISRKWNPGFWHVIPAGENLFEVRSGCEGFIVDEGKRTRSCRMWQLSGIPYVHATKVIFLINKVLPGMNFWPDQSMYSTVLPPKPRKIHSRPRKKRIRSIGEGGSLTRVSKVGSQASCSNCKKPKHNKASCTEPVVEQTLKPKEVLGKPRKKKSIGDVEDVDVVLRGLVRDEGVGGSRGDASGSRGRDGAGGSKGGAGRSRGGASGSRGGAGGSRGGASVSREGDSGSTGGAGGSRGGASGSKRKSMSSAGTQKRQGKKKVGTSGFAKRFELQDEPEQTQDEPQQTQHEPMQTQDEDQVEQTQEQAEIELTQVEQTQEQNQLQVQPQEQPQQVTLRTPSARIL